ncbi:DinB family protein [Actinomadura parmotrematis]|uniref:DinB family protein n=1 Tax=Actinomadura parmotrematis TaxID=2864039 RepID=A0ABS7FMU7_9ACTN|nr:DinB family protein [Actinomadura parmotrematis]MBW8481701.1 DinB family protein [Actinomadura parmotrematis]
MGDFPTSIAATYDEVRERLVGRLAGLTDDEYRWEPVPGCWSVRLVDGRWSIDGEGGGPPPPDPVPFTTIAWRLGHIGMTFLDYDSRLFGDGPLAPADIKLPGSATEAIAFVEGAEREWQRHVERLTGDGWARPLGPRFKSYADNTATDLVLHVLDEFTHHAAEVGVMRDLYNHRSEFLPS